MNQGGNTLEQAHDGQRLRFGVEMTEIREVTTGPEFTLTDTQGQSVTLSDYRGQKHVVLVFNRGFR